MLDHSIYELVRKMEEDDKTGKTTISKHVKFYMRKTLDKIEAYKNSRHISGEEDSKGREKPFFNIVTAMRNVWYRATDLDRKDLNIIADKLENAMPAFLATIHIQEWMKKTAFGKFLNDWGQSLATYGTSILKFIEKEGELHCKVMPWSVMFVDPVDGANNPKIEKMWVTPAQLKKNENYDQEHVDRLIDAREARETPEGEDKDTKNEYIELYEVHGELPLSYLTNEDDDEKVYVQQMHVVTFVESNETGEFDEFTLISGREEKDPYMFTHLIEEDGRTLAIGSIEYSFMSQWMNNHTMKMIKDQLDLASKIIFQTSDPNYVGKNALENVANGDILTHKKDQPLTAIYNKADIGALQAQTDMWKRQGSEINGISEAMLGAQHKSGTAWRLYEAELMESHSLFELMTENKGLQLEAMMREYIIPHIKKKMNTTKKIMPTLEEHNIKLIDTKYIPAEVKRRSDKKIINALLSGKSYTSEQRDEDKAEIQEEIETGLSAMGNKRAIKPSEIDSVTWKKSLKDLEWEVEFNITGEYKDRQAMLSTLTTVFQTLISLQGQPMPPQAKLVFNKILKETNAVNPMELSQVEQQPVAPQPQQVQGGGSATEVTQPMQQPTQ